MEISGIENSYGLFHGLGITPMEGNFKVLLIDMVFASLPSAPKHLQFLLGGQEKDDMTLFMKGLSYMYESPFIL